MELDVLIMVDALLHVLAATLGIPATPHSFTQRVDHFSKKEPPDAFAQRYFESDAHFDEANGAVVLYISGEAPLPEPVFCDRRLGMGERSPM